METRRDEMAIILKTHELGEPKYFAGVLEVPMGLAVALSPNIFGAVGIDSKEDAEEILRDLPDYNFEISSAEFGMSSNLSGLDD